MRQWDCGIVACVQKGRPPQRASADFSTGRTAHALETCSSDVMSNAVVYQRSPSQSVSTPISSVCHRRQPRSPGPASQQHDRSSGQLPACVQDPAHRRHGRWKVGATSPFHAGQVGKLAAESSTEPLVYRVKSVLTLLPFTSVSATTPALLHDGDVQARSCTALPDVSTLRQALDLWQARPSTRRHIDRKVVCMRTTWSRS